LAGAQESRTHFPIDISISPLMSPKRRLVRVLGSPSRWKDIVINSCDPNLVCSAANLPRRHRTLFEVTTGTADAGRQRRARDHGRERPATSAGVIQHVITLGTISPTLLWSSKCEHVYAWRSIVNCQFSSCQKGVSNPEVVSCLDVTISSARKAPRSESISLF